MYCICQNFLINVLLENADFIEGGIFSCLPTWLDEWEVVIKSTKATPK